MNKIAIVCPSCFSEHENDAARYVHLVITQLHLEHEIEVLTMSDGCVEGMTFSTGVAVHHYAKERHSLNSRQSACHAGIQAIRDRKDYYDIFLFFGYDFELTKWGLPIVHNKSVLFPMITDRAEMDQDAFHDLFSMPRALGFTSPEEREFVYSRFYNECIPSHVVGAGIAQLHVSDSSAFKRKYGLERYILCLSPDNNGDCIDNLFKNISHFRKEHLNNNIAVVVFGDNSKWPEQAENILWIDPLDEKEKSSGMAGAEVLILPSISDNQFLTVLEALSAPAPLLVNGGCDVARGHCINSNGGLYYNNRYEFEAALAYLLERGNVTLGENGKEYVDHLYTWPVVMGRFHDLIAFALRPVQRANGYKDDKKIGFVIPWYGETIPGGAEMVLRGLVHHLRVAGVPLEVLTTCVEKFSSDWSFDYHTPGLTVETGIPVRRFRARPRNEDSFEAVNKKLMMGQAITSEEEQTYIQENINSPELYAYLEQEKEGYAAFVFIPYMFGTTYYGLSAVAEKSVLIPCLHEEAYAHLSLFKEAFSNVRGMIFHSKPEADLARSIYDLSHMKSMILGGGVDKIESVCVDTFRSKYNIKSPFILYAGRKDKGKNVHELLAHFARYKLVHKNELKLVLIGGDRIHIPASIRKDVVDMGFIAKQDKYNAYAAASVLCQPSKNESFSLVIMESWLCGRPVLVNAGCDVTTDFAKRANGGLYYGSYDEFEAALEYIQNHPDQAAQLGANGREYVENNFIWQIIIERYMDFFSDMCG